MRSLGVAAILLLTLSTAGMAQRNHPPRGEFKSFASLAKHFDTTADALEQAYSTARQANPHLSRGQFVKALVLEQKLGDQKKNVTSRGILEALALGKTIQEALESLGLSTDEAKTADSTAQEQVTLYAQEA